MFVDIVKYDKHNKIHRCEQKGSVDISSSFRSVRGRFVKSDKCNSNCVFTHLVTIIWSDRQHNVIVECCLDTTLFTETSFLSYATVLIFAKCLNVSHAGLLLLAWRFFLRSEKFLDFHQFHNCCCTGFQAMVYQNYLLNRDCLARFCRSQKSSFCSSSLNLELQLLQFGSHTPFLTTACNTFSQREAA